MKFYHSEYCFNRVCVYYEGMTLQRNQPEHANAAFLCRPLYIIYLESAAFQEVYPDLIASVTIDGDPDEGKKVSHVHRSFCFAYLISTSENASKQQRCSLAFFN